MAHPHVILSTGSLYLYDTALVFALAEEVGFDGIEVMCDERWTTRDPAYLAALAARHSQPVRVVHTPFSGRVPGWGRDRGERDRVQRSVALAEALGATTVVVHLPLRLGLATLNMPPLRLVLPWGTAHADVFAWLGSGAFAAYQATTSVQLAVENMPAKIILGRRINPAFWNTPGAWASVHTCLTLDTTHWATFGIDPLDAYHLAGRRVRHIHLSNYDGREHRLPHRGHMDLAAFLRGVAEDDFDGTVCLELSPDALAFENIAAARRNLRDSLAFVREHLGQAVPSQA